MNNLEFSQKLLELVREIESKKGTVEIEDIYEYLLNEEKEFIDTVEQDEPDEIDLPIYDDDWKEIGHYTKNVYFDNSFIQD